MRKRLLLLVLFGVLIVTVYALADERELTLVEIDFGEVDNHAINGVNLGNLEAEWNANGLYKLRYRVSPRRGLIVFQDVLVVNDGKVLYKRSEHRTLGIPLHFHMTVAKRFDETVYLSPPVAPFTFETGEIWWIIGYTEGGTCKQVAVIWSMKTNKFMWKPYQP